MNDLLTEIKIKINEESGIADEVNNMTNLIEKPKSKSLYNKAINLITGTKDFYHNIIGFVIYYNNKFEKDAFINDTYRMLMDNPLTQFETLVNTKTYININIIKKYIVDSDNLKTKLIPILKNELNKNYNWFYNMACKVVKNYINKFGKIYVKAQKDINEQYTILDNNFNNILLESPPLA